MVWSMRMARERTERDGDVDVDVECIVMWR